MPFPCPTLPDLRTSFSALCRRLRPTPGGIFHVNAATFSEVVGGTVSLAVPEDAKPAVTAVTAASTNYLIRHLCRNPAADQEEARCLTQKSFALSVFVCLLFWTLYRALRVVVEIDVIWAHIVNIIIMTTLSGQIARVRGDGPYFYFQIHNASVRIPPAIYERTEEAQQQMPTEVHDASEVNSRQTEMTQRISVLNSERFALRRMLRHSMDAFHRASLHFKVTFRRILLHFMIAVFSEFLAVDVLVRVRPADIDAGWLIGKELIAESCHFGVKSIAFKDGLIQRSAKQLKISFLWHAVGGWACIVLSWAADVMAFNESEDREKYLFWLGTFLTLSFSEVARNFHRVSGSQIADKLTHYFVISHHEPESAPEPEKSESEQSEREPSVLELSELEPPELEQPEPAPLVEPRFQPWALSAANRMFVDINAENISSQTSPIRGERQDVDDDISWTGAVLC